MSTLSAEGLEAVLGSIGVESAIPLFPDADLQRDPMSIFVSYLAETLAQLTHTDPDLAFGAIQWPNDEGDLVIVLPKLRLKNVNAKVFASELMHKVRLRFATRHRDRSMSYSDPSENSVSRISTIRPSVERGTYSSILSRP
jgi:hypothetical protein